MSIFKGKDPESSIFRDRRGASAIEFALLLPLLLLFFFGMIIYFNYLMIDRRIDMAANDISAIIAKEGRVAESFVTVSNPCTTVFPTISTYQEYHGGRTNLSNTVNTLLPILIYPLNYKDGNPVPVTVNYHMVMAGVPLWTKIGNSSGIDQNTVKTIWELKQNADFTPTITGREFRFDAISNDTLFKVDNQGQSYIALAIEYPYKQTAEYTASLISGAELGGYALQKGGLFGIDFKGFGPNFTVRKEAAYPVRPTTINAAGEYIPYNDMNICTDCDVHSDALAPKCKTGCANFQFDTNVSGCVFD